jgi:formate/nitrite transporter FocA (FNT family)
MRGIIEKVRITFSVQAFGGQKVVSNFFNKPLERHFILENNQHITLSKVVNNFMMLYIGVAVGGSVFSIRFFNS